MTIEKKQKNIQVTPLQMASLLVLEGQIAQLQVGANQLGGFLKLTKEADILIEAAQLIEKKKVEMQRSWETGIQVVSALSPSLVAP